MLRCYRIDADAFRLLDNMGIADDSRVAPCNNGNNTFAAGHHEKGRTAMATGETGFDDVSFDLISLQYHSLKAGHDYGQYVRDARNAGKDDIASLFEEVMAQDSERAAKCHQLLAELSSNSKASSSSN